MSVEFLPEVVDFFEGLAWNLHEKGYFGSYEFSRKYVDELIDDIKISLPTRLHKIAPKRFDKYGKSMKYAAFRLRKNKRTQWYVFFKTYKENGEIIYLVRYIFNNHLIAQYF
jgi:hypothetical protein